MRLPGLLAAAAFALIACGAEAAPEAALAPEAAPASAPQTAVPPAAPEPIFVDCDGKTVRVSDHRGQVVLLNFWATYCGPCRREVPLLEKLHAELEPKGLLVMGAAANGRDEGAMVRRTLQDLGGSFDTWLWVSAKDMKHYGVGPGLPATVIVDRAGAVRRRIQGIVDPDALRPLLAELLAEPAPSPPE